MTSAVPLTKSDETFQRLALLAGSGEQPDELTLLRLEHAAREGMNADAVNAYQALGLVAMFQWSIDGVRANFEHAVRLYPRAVVRANYGRALAHVHEAAGAAEQLEMACEQEPESLAFLCGAMTYRFCAGHWSRADEIFKQLSQRTREPGAEARSVKEAIDFAKKLEVRDETISKSVTCALEFLRDRKIRATNFSHSIDRLPGEETLYLDIQVAATAAKARALDDELTTLLFDAVKDLQLGVFGLFIEPQSIV